MCSTYRKINRGSSSPKYRNNTVRDREVLHRVASVHCLIVVFYRRCDLRLNSESNNDHPEFCIRGQRSLRQAVISLLYTPGGNRDYLKNVRLPGFATVCSSQRNRICRTGWIWSMVVMPYGDDWRRNRRLLWQNFQPKTVGQWHSSQAQGTRRFLEALLEDSSDLNRTVRL